MARKSKTIRPHPGHYVREWRRFKKLTQEGLAAKADLSPGMISQLETGVSAYTQPTIEAIASVIGCRAGDLISYPPDQIPEARRLATSDLVRSLGLSKADLAAILASELAQDAQPPLQAPKTGLPGDRE